LVSASITVPRTFPAPYGKDAVKFAVRPKSGNEWKKLKIGTLTLAVAPVMGRLLSKIRSPSKNEYVRIIALECIGVMM
jgi:hypothetical protein